jgi:isoleucyl-tRNA synthetase
MSLFSWLKDWKVLNELWDVIEPFVINLAEKNVPKYVTKLYENLAKVAQPAIDSLYKLKEKIKTSPNALDDYCFNQGVNAIESFAKHLLEAVEKLRA